MNYTSITSQQILDAMGGEIYTDPDTKLKGKDAIASLDAIKKEDRLILIDDLMADGYDFKMTEPIK